MIPDDHRTIELAVRDGPKRAKDFNLLTMFSLLSTLRSLEAKLMYLKRDFVRLGCFMSACDDVMGCPFALPRQLHKKRRPKQHRRRQRQRLP